MRAKSFFTLIELLVVIAIIAILASMLLPVLTRARETARRALCMSNLKQTAVSLSLYADEWEEWFPSNIWGSTAHFKLYYNDAPKSRKLLESYGFDIEGCMTCPSGLFRSQFWPPPTNWAWPLALNYTYAGGLGSHPLSPWYGYMYVGSNTPSVNRPIPHRGMADRPDEIMLMMDWYRPPQSTRALVFEYLTNDLIPYLGAAPPNHRAGGNMYMSSAANVQTVDGHVEQTTPSKSTYRFKNYYYYIYW